MSESCPRGLKSFCFQCGETDCEKYQPELPEWAKKSVENIMQLFEETRGEMDGEA